MKPPGKRDMTKHDVHCIQERHRLEKVMRNWQEVLRLRDWVLDVVVCGRNGMTLQDVAGEIEWNFEQKTAVIRILCKNELRWGIIPQSQEKTLIHELLHLHFILVNEALGDNQTAKDLLHQSIELIAQGMWLCRDGIVYEEVER